MEKPVNQISTFSLNEVIKHYRPENDHILKGLVDRAMTTWVWVPPSVDAHAFVVTASYCIAGGCHFDPYGEATPAKTLLYTYNFNDVRTVELVSLLYNRPDEDKSKRAQATKFLKVFNQQPTRSDSSNSDIATTQQAVMPFINRGMEVVVFFGVPFHPKKRKEDPNHDEKFFSLLRTLNEQGVAALVFAPIDRRGADDFEINHLLANGGYLLELTSARGFSREYGTCFNVHRTRMSELDTVPADYIFWYRVVDGELVYGWQLPDDEDKKTVKRVEMADRLNRVQQLLDQGMPQKSIAQILNVDAATISRDAAKGKMQKSGPRKLDTDGDPDE